MAKKKKNKWVKLRHKVITGLFYPFFFLHAKLKYKIKFKKPDIGRRQYFVVSNHQALWDQFFVSLLLKRTIYYVASEDLYEKGFLSKLLHFAVAPIPIKKNATDVKAVMTMLRVKKEGGTIAIFPEGNRTYSGETGYIKPAIGALIKILKLPILCVQIKGGFGAHPRFASNIRKWPVEVSVKKIIEYDEYKDFSEEQCYQMIKDAIYFNEFDNVGDNVYSNKHSAEFMERAYYVCPKCKKIVKLYSNGQFVECPNCGVKLMYDKHLSLVPVNGDFPFTRLDDWYRYQENFITNLDLTPYFETPIFEDVATLVETAHYKKPKILHKDATIKLYANRYEVVDGNNVTTFLFDDISATTAQNSNTEAFYVGDKIYQLHGSERFTVLIYVNIFYHYKNNLVGGVYVQPSGDSRTSREFLGL